MIVWFIESIIGVLFHCSLLWCNHVTWDGRSGGEFVLFLNHIRRSIQHPLNCQLIHEKPKVAGFPPNSGYWSESKGNPCRTRPQPALAHCEAEGWIAGRWDTPAGGKQCSGGRGWAMLGWLGLSQGLPDLGSRGLKWDFAWEESKEGQLARILGQWKSFVQKWGITKCWSSQVDQDQDQVDPDQDQETIPGWQRPILGSAWPRPKVEQGDRNRRRMASTLPPQSSAGGLWKSYHLHRRFSGSRVSLFSHPLPRYQI